MAKEAESTQSSRWKNGVISVSEGATKILDAETLTKLQQRHLSGDWGQVSDNDKKLNSTAVKAGTPTCSCFTVGETSITLVTIHQHARTLARLTNEMLPKGKLVLSEKAKRVKSHVLWGCQLRHRSGDWGDILESEQRLNDAVQRFKIPVSSTYRVGSASVSLTTDGPREKTYFHVTAELPHLGLILCSNAVKRGIDKRVIWSWLLRHRIGDCGSIDDDAKALNTLSVGRSDSCYQYKEHLFTVTTYEDPKVTVIMTAVEANQSNPPNLLPADIQVTSKYP